MIARALLSEEGDKILTKNVSDAMGVAWVLRNRYFEWYFSESGVHHYDTKSEDWWLKATTTGIYGMGHTGKSFAIDFLGNYDHFGNDKSEAISSYNIAKHIAIQVLVADPSQDPTRGADSYADASDVNAIEGTNEWYKRTHFYILQNGYDNAWCMSDATVCD